MWCPRSILLYKLSEWCAYPDYTSITALSFTPSRLYNNITNNVIRSQSPILPLGRHPQCTYLYCVNKSWDTVYFSIETETGYWVIPTTVLVMKLDCFVIFSTGTIRIICRLSITTLAGLTVRGCQRLKGSQLNRGYRKVGQNFGSFYFHSTNN